MAIRITLHKDAWMYGNGVEVPARVEVKVFENHAKAVSWLVEDSYFGEAYTRLMTWERLDDER